MAVNRKCQICGRSLMAHEHYKIAWVDTFPVYICSEKCYKEYVKEWRGNEKYL